MNFADVRFIYGLSCVGLALIILLPMVLAVVSLPSGERFSELWMLGENHLTEGYPFNVKGNEVYSVYVGVGNHMGSPAYYVLYVKFRNQTGSLPNATSGVPSSLPPLYEYRVVVADNASSEVGLVFSFSNVSFNGGKCYVGNLVVNGMSFPVDQVVSWDSDNSGYYFQIFVELWIYDPLSGGFGYHNRFVSSWLNMTTSL